VDADAAFILGLTLDRTGCERLRAGHFSGIGTVKPDMVLYIDKLMSYLTKSLGGRKLHPTPH